MKEKAMLIAAAKAAGIYDEHCFAEDAICGWNPLQDNDDAMSLYAEMEFTIEYDGEFCVSSRL